MYGEPKNDIDGSLDNNYLYIQCAGTSEQKDPWMVDLKSKHNIFTVAITNRGNCCAEKINGGEIRIGNYGENGGIKNPICGVITSMSSGQTLAFDCDGMVGQYVTIHIPRAERSVTICEVQVFGLPSDDAATSMKPETKPRKAFIHRPPESDNLASRGITSQSSTYDHLGASKNAIDSSPSAIYSSGHCSHTDLDVEPWWRVDLMSTFNVTKVKITNRGCCCPERINGAEIRIGNIPEDGGTQNTICVKIESLGRGKEREYVCGMVGRYVTITIPGRIEYLTLCEVKVYGNNVSEGYAGKK
ncbi:hypothetical protein GDO78_020082 [Eleutherodactylus coqui]|nr:hypothetical protein GDO78_020082 [Eleutherodactylus coqui]